MDFTRANLMLTLLEAGRWAELESELAQPHSGSLVSRAIAAGVQGLLSLARQQAFAPAWSPGPPPETDDPSDSGWIAIALAAEERARGNDAAALEHALRSVDRMYDYQLVSDDFVHVWPLALELALAVGDQASVDRLMARIDDAAKQMRIPLAVAAHRDRGEALLLPETDQDRAESLLRRAVTGFGTWGSPQWRARTEGELGLLLERLGRHDEATTLLRGAVAALTELGAEGWVAPFRARVAAPVTADRGPVLPS
jgi:hypothetical protein